jgi:hypothetical protein
VRGKDDRRAVGDLVELFDEAHAAFLEAANDVEVVHDFAANVKRQLDALERKVDDVDRPNHPGAEAPRRREQDSPGKRGNRCAAHDARDSTAVAGARYRSSSISHRSR